FFQAEDGIRDGHVTGVQTCALPILSKLRRKRHLASEEFTYLRARTTRIPKITLTSPSLWANFWSVQRSRSAYPTLDSFLADVVEIGRASCRERVWRWVGAGAVDTEQ